MTGRLLRFEYETDDRTGNSIWSCPLCGREFDFYSHFGAFSVFKKKCLEHFDECSEKETKKLARLKKYTNPFYIDEYRKKSKLLLGQSEIGDYC